MSKSIPIDVADGITAKGKAVVTASVPAAADIGAAMLRKGGNAFDAAVAACLVETVALPMKCGLAGDLVALVREAGKKPRALVSVGGGASALAKGAKYTETGPCSIGIPGAPDGYAKLANLGRLKLTEIAQPAIEHAQAGLAWSPIAVTLTQEAEPLLRKFNGATPYLPDGGLPKAGDPLRPRKLADVITSFVDLGPALFEGPIGRALISKIQSSGGFLSAEDLATRPAHWKTLESASLGSNCRLYATPYPTHGRDLITAVELLDRADLNSLETYCQIADGLVNAAAGTSVVCSADSDGNAVVVVHSNSFPQYGSGVVVEDYDLILSNRPGRGFDIDAEPSAPNAPAVGKVPITTLHAWMLETSDGDFIGASPGGQNQLPWNLQTLEMLLAGERDLRELAISPRWGLVNDGTITMEQGHKLADVTEVSLIPPLTMRSVNQIIALPRGGDRVSASADPRTGARACAVN